MSSEKNHKNYTVEGYCSNCGHSSKVTIPHGQEAGRKFCPRCGCYTFSCSPVWPRYREEKRWGGWEVDKFSMSVEQHFESMHEDAAFGNFNGQLIGNW